MRQNLVVVEQLVLEVGPEFLENLGHGVGTHLHQQLRPIVQDRAAVGIVRIEMATALAFPSHSE